MFTGLIQDIATITAIKPMQDDGKKIYFQTALPLHHFSEGCSVAHDGVCLTVTDFTQKGDYILYGAELSKETLSCTTTNQWQVNDHINVETSLKVGDALGGHFVLGHVDATSTVAGIEKEADYWVCHFAMDDAWRYYIARKGSVALNGVSLTVNAVTKSQFSLTLIPHTIAHTNLQYLQKGDMVNIEIDPLMRYAARIMEYKYD